MFNLTGERQSHNSTPSVVLTFAAAKGNRIQVEVLVVVIALGSLGIVLSIGWYCYP